jgi:hypothetical protein
MGEKRYMQGFGGKPEERPRHRRDGNIKINLRKMGWGYGLDRYGSGSGQVSGCCECGNEPSGSI